MCRRFFPLGEHRQQAALGRYRFDQLTAYGERVSALYRRL
jgi:hypothetical protein